MTINDWEKNRIRLTLLSDVFSCYQSRLRYLTSEKDYTNQASRRRSTLFIGIALSFALTACERSRQDQIISLAKCGKAGHVLEDARLIEASEFAFNSAVIKLGIGTKNPALEAMELSQILRDELEPQGNATNPLSVLKTAQSWADSSACKTALIEFDQAVKNEVEKNMRGFADSGTNESCKAFTRQYELTYRNVHTRTYREKLIPYLRQTMESALGKLRSFQAATASKQLVGENLQNFGGEVFSQCTESRSLAQAMLFTEVVRNAKSESTEQLERVLSERTAAIEGLALPESIAFKANLVGAKDGPRFPSQCGELAEVICMPTLQISAIKQSLDESAICDKAPTTVESCSLDANGRISANTLALQLKTLKTARVELETYLSDPRKFNFNTDSEIQRLAEECKHSAIRLGLRDIAYAEHVKKACLPEAYRRFESPQRDLLTRVNFEIARLTRSEPSERPKKGDANAVCVDQWSTAFRNINGSDAIVTQDQLQEWTAWCAAGRTPEKAHR